MPDMLSLSMPKLMTPGDVFTFYLARNFPGTYVVVIFRPIISSVFSDEDAERKAFRERRTRYQQFLSRYGFTPAEISGKDAFLPFITKEEAEKVYHEYRDAEPDDFHKASVSLYLVTEDGSEVIAPGI